MGALIQVKVDRRRANEIMMTISKFLKKHRIVRGMIAYSILWPVGSMVQQAFEGKKFSEFDWKKVVRFCLYGTLIQGPALYCWMRVANKMWPRSDIRSALAKALTEQVAFDPFSITLFLYAMTIFEGKTHEQARREVSSKFLSIYAIGLVYWPITQTINFGFVKPKNQVIYVSFSSLIWTTFLAYMKAHPIDEETKKKVKVAIEKRYEHIKEVAGEVVEHVKHPKHD